MQAPAAGYAKRYKPLRSRPNPLKCQFFDISYGTRLKSLADFRDQSFDVR